MADWGDTRDEAANTEARRLLSKLFQERWALASTDTAQVLRLGLEGWPFPVPLMKSDAGWQFDAAAGVEEIENRRVGRNELIAIETCYRLVDAQEDYRLRNPQGDGVRAYSDRFRSTDGARDGLYWVTEGMEEASPLQKALKDAWNYAEGRTEGAPWFGYRFRLLTSQGSSAPGGAYDYVINGSQVGGWALVAYPASYGNSGVMTFLCNQNGVIYQKDLGDETETVASGLKSFDPDDSRAIVTERF